jgi:outer membrane protein assembly factor BamD (BamD/ComL family)
MGRRRRLESLMAASLYDDLSEDEQRILDASLERQPKLRAQREDLARFVEAIQEISPPQLDMDLLSGVRARLTAQAPEQRRVRWRWGLSAAAGVALVVLLAGAFSAIIPNVNQSKVRPFVADSGDGNSPVRSLLVQATAMTADHNYTGAYRCLKEAVTHSPKGKWTAEAQLRLARLVFEDLHWYGEADACYETLLREYGDRLKDLAEVVERRDLLAEAREDGYASLNALDAARQRSRDPLAKLEKVIAAYPGKMVASLAAEEMARVVLQQSGENSRSLLWAMEQARDRCEDPVAVAELNYELARRYWQEDWEKARSLFREVESNTNAVLAQRERARDALYQLESALREGASESD